MVLAQWLLVSPVGMFGVRSVGASFELFLMWRIPTPVPREIRCHRLKTNGPTHGNPGRPVSRPENGFRGQGISTSLALGSAGPTTSTMRHQPHIWPDNRLRPIANFVNPNFNPNCVDVRHVMRTEVSLPAGRAFFHRPESGGACNVTVCMRCLISPPDLASRWVRNDIRASRLRAGNGIPPGP